LSGLRDNLKGAIGRVDALLSEYPAE